MAIAPRPKSRVRLYPETVYTLAGATEALGMRNSSLRREAQADRLRTADLCGRLYTTGRWLLEWIEACEVQRTPKVKEDAA